MAQRHQHKRADRYRLDVQLSATFLGAGGTEVLQGRTTDISLGGIGTVLSGELSAGQVVDLRFIPPHADPIEVRAVVRHRNGYRYGLDFLSLDGTMRARIALLCRPYRAD